MKKIVRNLALVLIPIFIYYTIFIIFEPNNYFGLRKSATGTNIIATLREYERNPTEAVILGDSRLAHVDMDIVNSTTQANYSNLSYGGASLKEQVDILNWVIEKNPNIEKIVFLGSFYTFNKSYSHNRMVIDALDNPFVYLTNLGYNINMITELYYTLAGIPQGAAEETMEPADYLYQDITIPSTGEAVELRTTVAKHLLDIDERSSKWELNTEVFEQLLDAIKLCKEKGISFVFVLPPDHPAVYEYIVKPYGIEDPMQQAIEEIRQTSAQVLDYEFTQNGFQDDQFYDCFHLDTKRGLPVWTEELFIAIEQLEN